MVRAGVAAVALSLAVGVVAPIAQAQSGTIKIVSSLPRTGSSKGQTDTIVNAFKMAFDESNYSAGGFTIEYEDMDDATPARGAWDAGKEAENANKAVADADVMVYLGTFNSGAAKVAIPILNRSSLVMISPANTYPGLTKPGKGEPNEPDIYYPTGVRNYSRVVPADDLQGAVAANWAKALGVTKVYVLDDTELYGHGIAQVFADTAAKIGLTVLGGPEGIDSKASDYRALATKIRGTGAEMVYYGGITQNNAGKLFKDLRSVLGPNAKMMGPDGIFEQAFIDDAGDAAEGVYVTFGGIGPSKLTGKGAAWYADYKAKYGTEPEAYAAYGYEAAKVALDAIARAGTKDREAIRAAVFATSNYDGVLGTWSFDANGDTTLTTMSGRAVVGGKFDDENSVTLQAE
ncbi:MAG: branched-chain amino acid ABC transporter substrate-binding protein [Chloroflexi bacterium]|nr:branched-chain amino acid ABC transporter substrate-binding protein [Chloroflexota bacterium]